jgi:hypothetical protein
LPSPKTIFTACFTTSRSDRPRELNAGSKLLRRASLDFETIPISVASLRRVALSTTNFARFSLAPGVVNGIEPFSESMANASPSIGYEGQAKHRYWPRTYRTGNHDGETLSSANKYASNCPESVKILP